MGTRFLTHRTRSTALLCGRLDTRKVGYFVYASLLVLLNIESDPCLAVQISRWEFMVPSSDKTSYTFAS